MDFFNCIGFIDIDPGLCHPIQYNNQQKGIAQEKHRSTLPVYWVEAMIRGKGYASSSKQLAHWLTEMGVLLPPVKTLSIEEVIRDAVVDGPVPELAEEIRHLFGARSWLSGFLAFRQIVSLHCRVE